MLVATSGTGPLTLVRNVLATGGSTMDNVCNQIPTARPLTHPTASASAATEDTTSLNTTTRMETSSLSLANTLQAILLLLLTKVAEDGMQVDVLSVLRTGPLMRTESASKSQTAVRLMTDLPVLVAITDSS